MPDLKPLRCPSCKTTSEDTEFIVAEGYKATRVSVAQGVDRTGRLIVLPIDRGEPTSIFRAEVTCRGCGYRWVTSRLTSDTRESSGPGHVEAVRRVKARIATNPLTSREDS